MPISLPVRRFFHSTTSAEAPEGRFGAVQWILTRGMYRFQIFDLAQVPVKNRPNALRLQLAQWTPFSNTSYYVGRHGQNALVWGWDAEKINQAVLAQGLQPTRVRVLPESVLHSPILSGLCLTRCREGYEGQLWRSGHLVRSRWWPQLPNQEEWLLFQRDTGIEVGEQQSTVPLPRPSYMSAEPWVGETAASNDAAIQLERVAIALLLLVLLAPTLWYGFAMVKLQLQVEQLKAQQAQLQREAAPNTQARLQALDYRSRIESLLALDAYPGQLTLMAKIADVLPNNKSYLKSWDFQQGQLKITLASGSDISTTALINVFQQAGPFRDVKALPGPDPKVVTFEMAVEAR